MKKIITGILIIMLSAVTSQAVYAKAVGKFVKVEGRVDITRPGKPAVPVNVGTDIFEKDIIRTKSNSKAEIHFVDGNVLRLAQKTRVEVSEYISDSSKRSTILNLFRGKIQNKVKKMFGGIFGRDKNRYEVHTPTSVCGVRGTDFFMSYHRGVSQATFKEGFGYAYNINQPDNVMEIQAGQSMVISSTNASPVMRTVSPVEINQHEEETTPAEEERENGEGSSGEGPDDVGGGGGFSPDENTEELMLADDVSESSSLTGSANTITEVVDANTDTNDETGVEIIQEITEEIIAVTRPTISGRLMGIVPGTHYEGEYVLPRSTDPYQAMDGKRIEAGRYQYDYFLADDGTYLRGSSEEKDSETGTWTMNDYLPDGTLFTETGTEGDFNPQTTESTWTQTDIASIATPSAGYYTRYTNDFAASMIAGIGDFTGEIQVPSELWSATEASPLEITLSGQYTSTGAPISLVKSHLSGSVTDGGIYSGFLSGKADTAAGFIHALYISPDGTELGVIKGDFSGAFDGIDAWSATGTMYPTVFSTNPGTITNDNFLANTGYGYLEVDRLTGDFSGGRGVGIKAHGFGGTSYIMGNDWGIFDLVFGYGEYDETIVSDTWSGSVNGFGMFGENDDGMWHADITGSSWVTGEISGQMNGEFLTMTKYGTIEGDLIGPAGSGGDWTAVSQGTWQKTGDLQFSSRLDGGMYSIRTEEGGNYYNMTDASWYSYHYDLKSDQGGYQFYDAANDTNTYVHLNRRDYDGTVTDYQREEYVYNNSTLALVSYSSTTETTFDLTTLADATANTGLTWDYSDPTWTNYNMYHTGWFEGILGGLDSPWAANSNSPANIILMGFYEAPYFIAPGESILFANDIESFNSSNESFTTFDGGTYSGYIGGTLSSTINGNLYAIYIDPGNNAGIMLGDLLGTADSMSGIWDATGGIYPVQLFSSIGVTPDNFISNNIMYKDYYLWDDASYGGEDGYFYDGSNNVIGYLNVGGGDFFSKNISGEPWGVWQNVVGGSYTGTPGTDWTYGIRQEMWDEFNNVSGMIGKYGVSGGTWSASQIEADVLGAWVDLNDVVVGVSSGKIAGTYDPTEMTWQTYGSGVWIKVGQFINMTTTGAGQATLAELNMPAFEIGRTDLSGTGTTMTVAMTDVTFFASSTGGDPQIWATDNITGTYTGTPYVGDYVYMSNSDSSVTADFNLKKWDNNNWAADISNGNGTITRTDIAGTVDVEFGGVAGGTYTGTTSGTFSGEGAGTAR